MKKIDKEILMIAAGMTVFILISLYLWRAFFPQYNYYEIWCVNPAVKNSLVISSLFIPINKNPTDQCKNLNSCFVPCNDLTFAFFNDECMKNMVCGNDSSTMLTKPGMKGGEGFAGAVK
jgi:hypothetical protein